MADHFHDEFVKLSYKVEHRSHLDPSQEDLEEWDQTLQDRYGSHLQAAMSNHGIDDTKRNRSIIVTLSLSSTGAGRTQVERACEYWTHVSDMRVS